MAYKSGKMFTGTAGTIDATIPESGDEIAEKPKTPKGAKAYRAIYPPLNLATPNGRLIQFINGYFITTDKDLISYLDKEVGKTCELC